MTTDIGSLVWYGVGFLGQGLFSLRFLVQWICSERAKKSIVPRAFWYLSIAGASTLLAYAIWRQDPVIILGQSTGVIIYTRNLVLIGRQRARPAPVDAGPESGGGAQAVSSTPASGPAE